MDNLNSVLIEGNLTADPELKFGATGAEVGVFSLAVNRSWKKDDQWQKEVSFFDVTVFGKLARSCKDYLVKGQQVRVMGRLKQDRWDDAQSGQKRSKVHVVAEHVDFGKKPEAKEGG